MLTGLTTASNLKASPFRESNLKSLSLTSQLGQKRDNIKISDTKNTSSLVSSTQSRLQSSTKQTELSSNLLSSKLILKVKTETSQNTGVASSQRQPTLSTNVTLTGQILKRDVPGLASKIAPIASTPLHKPDSKISRQDKERKGKKSKKEAPGLADVKLKEYGSIEKPIYDFEHSIPTVSEIEIPKFVPPEKDEHILRMHRPVHDIEAMKVNYIQRCTLA